MKPPRRAFEIEEMRVVALSEALNEPFEISSGAQDRTSSVLVRIRLGRGAVGYGEGAPSSSFNGDDQQKSLAAVLEQIPWAEGRSVSDPGSFLNKLDRRMPPERGAARAAIQMAVLDAWGSLKKIPLRVFFGGRKSRVVSDVTVTLVSARKAGLAAAALARRWIRTIKVKVGRDLDDDESRLRAVARAAPRARLIIDANQGYGAREALEFLSRLKRSGIVPVLFEQPVRRDDLDGLFDVEKHGGVSVCADESAFSFKSVAALARRKFPSAVNIKLMKYGIVEALRIVDFWRRKGRALMIGGNIETSLAMSCSAHLACGRGCFDFVDLDTPLWFSRGLWSGPSIGARGIYDLSRVKSGIGARPLAPISFES